MVRDILVNPSVVGKAMWGKSGDQWGQNMKRVWPIRSQDTGKSWSSGPSEELVGDVLSHGMVQILIGEVNGCIDLLV